MTQALKITAYTLAGLLIILLIAAVALYLTTAGDYPVHPTVTDDPTLTRLTIDGYTFHAETFGDPANPVVIVLHGGPGGDYRSLLHLQALADQYYIVFYDQRGSGLSERVPAEQLSYQQTLQDLDALVDLYGRGQPVHLIGHSWGAMVISGYLGYAPEKVNRAVLGEPGFLNAAEAEAWQAEFGNILSGREYLSLMITTGFEQLHVTGPDPYAAEDYLVGTIVHYFSNHPNNTYHCPGEPFDAPAWRWGTTAGNAIQNKATPADLDSLSSHAAGYHKPLLFLAGECNTWIGPELQTTHATLYPNAQLTVIPHAGHDMFWDNPEATLTAVRTFLNQ